jgi:hypothetical protein
MGSKWDIEKFTGDNDFGLWKVKMEAVLIQQKCEKALKGEGWLPVTMSRAKKPEMVDKAGSAIVLCLGGKVLREVAKEPTAASMWSKFEYMYMTKSLAHRQVLKQQFYSFKMVKSKAVMELLAEFNKIIGDLENTEVRLEDAGALMVWCCLEDEEGDVGHLGSEA